MEKFDFSKKIHFGLHQLPLQETQEKITKYFYQIVLKRPNGTIVDKGFTGLEVYAYPYNGEFAGDANLKLHIDPPKYKLLYICMCLNYLIHTEKIRSLREVTPDMLYRCFDTYRTSETSPGRSVYVKQDTLDKFVSTVCCFFANMALVNPGMAFDPKDLLHPVRVYNKKNQYGKGTEIYVPYYNKKAIPSLRQTLLRDIPEEAIGILMEEIKIHDEMIYFAAVLQAYAGLRASECMNLRREDSPLSTSPGIEIHKIGEAVSEMRLDLTHEYQMRSDFADVGKIKRDTSRMTTVYPKNLPIVYDAYKNHLDLISNKPSEKDFAPIFISAGGKAMKTDTYQRRFNNVVQNHLRPRLLNSEDPLLVAFGQALLTNNFPTHGLRHYFSVHLAIDGLDASQIMSYRGDKNIDSSVVYLQNKGILEEQLRKSHSIALTGLTKKGDYAP